MKDMKAPPKKMALMKDWMFAWSGFSRSQTVPIITAKPMYIATRMPYAMISRYDLMNERWMRAMGMANLLADSSLASALTSVSIELRAISSVSSVTVAEASRDLCHDEWTMLSC